MLGQISTLKLIYKGRVKDMLSLNVTQNLESHGDLLRQGVCLYCLFSTINYRREAKCTNQFHVVDQAQ